LTCKQEREKTSQRTFALDSLVLHNVIERIVHKTAAAAFIGGGAVNNLLFGEIRQLAALQEIGALE
jgi:hypothetical protein